MMQSFSRIVDAYLDYARVERGLRPASIEAYSQDLRRFEKFLAKTLGEGAEPRPEDVTGFLVELGESKITSRSQARMLSAFRGLFKFALRERLLTVDPTAKVELPKLSKRLPNVLSIEEVNELLAAPDLSTPAGIGRAHV
jgi:integrase/recombinase XerD